eukprot:2561031-Pleurochrysis_carterae.AAC.3
MGTRPTPLPWPRSPVWECPAKRRVGGGRRPEKTRYVAGRYQSGRACTDRRMQGPCRYSERPVNAGTYRHART